MIKIYDRTKKGISELDKHIIKSRCRDLEVLKKETYEYILVDLLIKFKKVWINEIHNDFYFQVIVEDHLTEIEVIREV